MPSKVIDIQHLMMLDLIGLGTRKIAKVLGVTHYRVLFEKSTAFYQSQFEWLRERMGLISLRDCLDDDKIRKVLLGNKFVFEVSIEYLKGNVFSPKQEKHIDIEDLIHDTDVDYIDDDEGA